VPRLEETIDIRAPIDGVFTALTDPRRGPEWDDNIVEVLYFSGYPVQEGATWRQVITLLGRHTTLYCRVLGYAPPNEGSIEVTGQLQATIWTKCQDLDGVTRVTQGIDFAMPGGLLGRMVSGVAVGAVHRGIIKSMQRQRDILEREYEVGAASSPTQPEP
jgi:hypothetical protein